MGYFSGFALVGVIASTGARKFIPPAQLNKFISMFETKVKSLLP